MFTETETRRIIGSYTDDLILSDGVWLFQHKRNYLGVGASTFHLSPVYNNGIDSKTKSTFRRYDSWFKSACC